MDFRSLPANIPSHNLEKQHEMYKPLQKIGWWSAAAIVVANMVGTGVFTSLGLQLMELEHPFTILSLWLLGGLTALFGAFSYAELGTRLPQSGGEYYFLSKIYHPVIGYLSGWVSLTVGFSASIALAAMAMSAYLGQFLPFRDYIIAIMAIVVTTFIHSFNLKRSRQFQNSITILKVLILVLLVIIGFMWSDGPSHLDFSGHWWPEVTTTAYAVALVYVIYAYSGWNAAAYIVSEIKDPKQNLPKALIIGTTIVASLYILLQMVFMHVVPMEALQGQIEIGQIVATKLFGTIGGTWISILISFLLLSSISAMIWVGPRVVRAMAETHQIWSFLAQDNQHGIPVRAIWLQSGISIFLIISSSFEQVLVYSGFVLQLFNTLAVFGVILLRSKDAQHPTNHFFLSPGYPLIQIIYLIISCWILGFLIIDRPRESLLGLLNLFFGGLSYWLSKQWRQEQAPNTFQ